MREIKFRAWDKGVGNKMIYFNLDNYQEQIKKIWSPKFITPIMQFTGLKDKNGKEIYEGDIVKIKGKRDGSVTNCPKYNCIVNEGNGCFWVKSQFLRVDGEIGFCKPIYDTILEVIGNIYENPELLKESSE